jgi:hypothetical protein
MALCCGRVLRPTESPVALLKNAITELTRTGDTGADS